VTIRADPRQKAVLLAAMAPHSGDWLSALPIASCGLRMDDESARMAVAHSSQSLLKRWGQLTTQRGLIVSFADCFMQAQVRR